MIDVPELDVADITRAAPLGSAYSDLALRYGRIGLAAWCVASAVAAGVCCGMYRSDAKRLANLSRREAGVESTASAKVARLTNWVFHNHGFQENRGFFVLRGMRATPVQVLERGGDCADKSRLLCAMLRQLNIPATMAMCFDPVSQAPVHTVVEAQVGPSEYMVADPVYDLTFPAASGRPRGLLALRKDASILTARLDELGRVRPRNHPVHAYRRQSSVYTAASTFNWQKNAATRLAHAMLHVVLGEAVYRLPRPLILEEPQVAVAGVCAMASMLFAVGFAFCSRALRIRNPSPPTEQTSAGAVRRQNAALSVAGPIAQPRATPTAVLNLGA